jgi:DNA-binding MurR/RpiR family transcriptional regulator
MATIDSVGTRMPENRPFMITGNDGLQRLLRQYWDHLTPGDRRVADYLVRTYPRFLFQTAAEIARELDTSISTITRFFPKIGFKSIRDAYGTLKSQTRFVADSPLDRFNARDRSKVQKRRAVSAALEADLFNLQQTFAALDAEAVDRFARLTAGARGAVYVLGSRKVFALAFYLYLQIVAVRPRVHLVRTDNSFEVEAAMDSGKGDVLILFDFRRYPRVHQRAAEMMKLQGVKIVGIVDSPLAPTASLADVSFRVETRGSSAFDSYTAAVGLINALVAETVRHLGRSARERCERMEAAYRHFGVWSWQNPIARTFPKPRT